MAASQIDFRPFLSITAGYDNGLNGVGVDPNGQPFNEASSSIQVSGGVSGLHSWRHTQVGLDYTASVIHFPNRSFYDGFNQTLLLGVTHQMSRHVSLTVRTSAGLFGQNFNQPILPQTVPFDPSIAFIPSNDFFDNRTMYFSTQADLQVQKSTRLSYSIGADGFMTRRRSTALYGVVGEGARGDVQYRLTRRSTIGGGYSYTHFSFNHIFSSTDLHGFVGSYAIRLTRSTEFSATLGAIRYETKFVQTVPVDPAIAILIGTASTRQVAYTTNWIPSGTGRLSYTMKRGVAYISGGRSITPGNGLFLTSSSTSLNGGYNYTALKRWSASALATYDRSTSLGNFLGEYNSYTVSANVSRQLIRYTHAVFTVNARKYGSGDFNNYNKWTYGVQLGLGFTPGDIPMRLW